MLFLDARDHPHHLALPPSQSLSRSHECHLPSLAQRDASSATHEWKRWAVHRGRLKKAPKGLGWNVGSRRRTDFGRESTETGKDDESTSEERGSSDRSRAKGDVATTR